MVIVYLFMIFLEENSNIFKKFNFMWNSDDNESAYACVALNCTMDMITSSANGFFTNDINAFTLPKTK